MINSEDYQHLQVLLLQLNSEELMSLNYLVKLVVIPLVPVTVSVSAPPVGNLRVDGAATASVTICTGDTLYLLLPGV